MMILLKEERDKAIARITEHYDALMTSLQGQELENSSDEKVRMNGKDIAKNELIKIDQKEVSRCIDVLTVELKHVLK